MWFRVAEGICLPCRQLRNGFVEWLGNLYDKLWFLFSFYLRQKSSVSHVYTKFLWYITIWLITVTYVKLHKKPFTLIYVWLMRIDETLKSAIEKFHNRTVLIDQRRDFRVKPTWNASRARFKKCYFSFHRNYMQVLCLAKKTAMNRFRNIKFMYISRVSSRVTDDNGGPI